MAGKLGITRYEAHNGLTVTFAAALGIGQAVTVSADKTVSAAGLTDLVVGTVVKDATAGQKGTIRLRGDVVPMVASGAVSAGDHVAASAGLAQADGGTDRVFGQALTGGSDGSEILVIVL